jgi:hypothetical protein
MVRRVDKGPTTVFLSFSNGAPVQVAGKSNVMTAIHNRNHWNNGKTQYHGNQIADVANLPSSGFDTS